MRLAVIYALVIATTLHVSGALPASNAVVKNDGFVNLSGTDGGRMLRRVEKDDDDRYEERGFNPKDLLKKLKPDKIAEKLHADKIKQTLKEVGDHDQWLQLQALKAKHGIK